MIKKVLFLLSSLAFSQASLAQTTLISNVQGYTLAGEQLRQFSAILFSDDKIDRLFAQGESLPSNQDIIHIDGKGKTLLPGLIDAHGHILSYGLSLSRADLVDTRSEQIAVRRTVDFAQANGLLNTDNNSAVNWILGRGWNQVQWQNKQFPTFSSLDQALPNNPVWLRRVDGHAGWANSAAMKLAGITNDTVSPAGGEIIKDSKGNVSGIFIDNAMALIENAIAPLSIAQQKATLVKAMQSLAAYGLTSVHDAGVEAGHLELYKQLSNENAMPIRVNAMLYLPSKQWQNTIKQGTYQSPDAMFAFNSVKIQADGALGSRGAALIDDYADHSGHKGLLLHDSKNLNNYIKTAMDAGFQVNTHAIGDNANKIVLDTYQKLIAQSQTKHLRHRIEHAQVLRLQDIPRFSALGIIASMQATHATSDKNMAQDRLGEQRVLGAYAWRKLLKANTIIAAGSDFPVESPNPFFGLHASITRQDKHNQPEGGWFAEQKMTATEALKSFTYNAAYSGHQEKLIGSLSAGKKADFILLQDNMFDSEQTKIWQNIVLATWVNGKQVYSLAEKQAN